MEKQKLRLDMAVQEHYCYYGNPMSHVTWHKIADELKNKFYIVAADLRGYGDSIGPEDGGENHLNYFLEQWGMIKLI